MGAVPRTRFHGCWKILGQARCGNTFEQEVAKNINWTEYINERAIATSNTVSKQRITLMSVDFLHTGYADHHIERASNPIEKITESKKTCKLWEEISTLNLVPVLGLTASVLDSIPSENQTAEVIG